jgi:hypothetical protein
MRHKITPCEPADLSSPEACRRELERTVDRVRAGLEPLNVGRLVAYAVSVARALQDDELLRRLEALEAHADIESA